MVKSRAPRFCHLTYFLSDILRNAPKILLQAPTWRLQEDIY